MKDTEKVFLGVAFVALAAIVIYNRMGVPLSVSALGVGAGPAPFANNPAPSPAVYHWQNDVSPWGSAPPMQPMIRRSSGISGIATAPSWSQACGGRCN